MANQYHVEITSMKHGTLPTINLIEPAGGQLKNNQPIFRWIAQDPDKEDRRLTYTLLVSKGGGNPFLNENYKYIFEGKEGEEVTVKPFILERDKAYSWAVLADDGGVGASRSQIIKMEV